MNPLLSAHVAGAVLLASSAAFAADDAPQVVVSIKPIYGLVAAVMEGVGQPDLILKSDASPHSYQLQPSAAATLQNAKLVFWVGPGLESFLSQPLAALDGSVSVVELDKVSGLSRLPLREGTTFAPASDLPRPIGEDDEKSPVDEHLWLDPMNAKAMVAAITATLVATDPAHALTYQANQSAISDRLDDLDKSLQTMLEPVRSKPFFVFHDAYRYFEQRYHVEVAGSVTLDTQTVPDPAQIDAIRVKLKARGATCVFAEPQSKPQIVDTIIAGTNAKAGLLDPEGATLKPGPDLYFQLMTNIATSLTACLNPAP